MTQNKRVIAVTGGIGSGKSTLAKMLTEQGNVLSCDQINAGLLQDKNYLATLKSTFPEAFDGEKFDRKKMARIIFSDENERKRLNAIAHPEIMRKMKEEIEKSPREVVFVEVPLLAGTAFEKEFSEIVVVRADMGTRIGRIMKRDGIDRDAALAKVLSQVEKLSYAHAKTYIVDNSGDLAALAENRDKLIKELFKKGE